MANQDPLGYYRALHVSPGASAEEIKLSYEFLKAEYKEERKQLDIGTIRAAYQTLTDPAERVRYDAGKLQASPVTRVRTNLQSTNSGPVLFGLLAIGLVAVMIIYGPSLKVNLTSYEPGDVLEWSANGAAIGTVVTLEDGHTFPGGGIADAYEIRPEGGGESEWYPASDLERHARRR